MSSNYLNILQITQPGNPALLEQAYQASKERYLRLTARGPLRCYRHELLNDAEKAYLALKNHPITDQVCFSEAGRQLSAASQPLSTPSRPEKPVSIVARRVNAQRNRLWEKPPIKSPVKQDLFQSQFVNRPARNRWAAQSVRIQNSPSVSKSIVSTAQLNDYKLNESFSSQQREDLYCKEVIYRLEGDMIRYSSRQELLALAGIWQIPLFRANMLMAQIVEAVRSNHLHEPTSREKQICNLAQKDTITLSVLVVFGFALLLFILIDLILVGSFTRLISH